LRLSYSSGFWRLGDKLGEILTGLTNGDGLSKYENVSLDFGNVLKLGELVTLQYEGNSYKAFYQRNTEHTVFPSLDGYEVITMMSGEILDILFQQKYEELIKYDSPEFVVEGPNNAFSVLSDGSVIAILRK
jgi:hypothetical protein